MNKIPISVIIMTKNNVNNMRKCLKSVSSFAQIFVVDSGSSDGTVEISREMGATIIPFNWNGKYPKKKQSCLDNLPFEFDYVLYVDADEEVVPELEAEIKELLQRGNMRDGYFVGFYMKFMNKLLKHGHRSYKLVLFNRKKGRFLDYDDLTASNMGELEGHYQPEIKGSTAVLRSCMIHYNHDSLYDYFHKHNRYSDWEAIFRTNGAYSNLKESQIWIRSLQKKLFHRFPLKWLVSFVHSFFIKLGFIDGGPGFHYALARAMYYWQVEVKIKELNYTKEQRSV